MTPKTRRIFPAALLCLVLFCGCGSDDKKTESVDLHDKVTAGCYEDNTADTDEQIVIAEDKTMQLKGFDEKELVTFYSEMMQEAAVQEADLCAELKTPYTFSVKPGDTETLFDLSVPLFGAEASVNVVMEYDSEEQTIFYHKKEYKLKAAQDK